MDGVRQNARPQMSGQETRRVGGHRRAHLKLAPTVRSIQPKCRTDPAAGRRVALSQRSSPTELLILRKIVARGERRERTDTAARRGHELWSGHRLEAVISDKGVLPVVVAEYEVKLGENEYSAYSKCRG